MKTSHAFWMFLPDGLEELFEMVRFERTDKAYDIWLDEKKKLSAEDYRNPDIVARGYTDYMTIQDYPLRGRPVFLHMRKTMVGQEYQRDIQLHFGTAQRGRLPAQCRVRGFFKI